MKAINTGTTNKIKTGASSMPPTITVASGRCVSEPIPVESAAGNSPMHADMHIIKTGSMRTSAARSSASSRE
jgi:hypothetical protein